MGNIFFPIYHIFGSGREKYSLKIVNRKDNSPPRHQRAAAGLEVIICRNTEKTRADAAEVSHH